jgi:hypothetical protein
MDIHKDCYSAIGLTQQDGPHRRETKQVERLQKAARARTQMAGGKKQRAKTA